MCKLSGMVLPAVGCWMGLTDSTEVRWPHPVAMVGYTGGRSGWGFRGHGACHHFGRDSMRWPVELHRCNWGVASFWESSLCHLTRTQWLCDLGTGGWGVAVGGKDSASQRTAPHRPPRPDCSDCTASHSAAPCPGHSPGRLPQRWLSRSYPRAQRRLLQRDDRSYWTALSSGQGALVSPGHAQWQRSGRHLPESNWVCLDPEYQGRSLVQAGCSSCAGSAYPAAHRAAGTNSIDYLFIINYQASTVY